MKTLLVLTPILIAVPFAAAHAAPSGSYRGSCTDITMNGPVLNATCDGSHNRKFETSLDTRLCRGIGIANDFGTLTCGGIDGTSREVRDGGGQGYGQNRQRSYGRGNEYGQGQDEGGGYRNDRGGDGRYDNGQYDNGYDYQPRRRPHYYDPNQD